MTLLSLVPLLAAPLLAPRQAPSPRPTGRAVAAASAQAAWPERLRRDARTAFTPRSAVAARATLDRGNLGPYERAEALMALGCAGATMERARLASWSAEGTATERRAAALALGELGRGVGDRLSELCDDPDTDVAACAALALLRTGTLSARARVDELTRGARKDLAERARNLLMFEVDPLGTGELPSARLLLDLRWNAARAFGLVDGQAWSVTLLGELVADERFLDAVILSEAALLSAPGVKDHLVGQLLEVGGEWAVRACVAGMPAELAELIEHGLWTPGRGQWDWILDEIGARGMAAEAVDLLMIARGQSGLNLRAIELLSRGGVFDDLEELSDGWADLTAGERILVCRALGNTHRPDVGARLADWGDDPRPPVAAAVLIARARLTEAKAISSLRTALLDSEAEGWALRVRLACELADDPVIGDLLSEVLPLCEDEWRIRVASSLGIAGRAGALIELREALDGRLPDGELGGLAVRALGSSGIEEDVELLADSFPLERRPILNRHLARALVTARHVEAMSVVRSALWRGPFDRSVLAAAVLIDRIGIYRLREELATPPSRATSQDIRRVGFALGEWGGLAEIGELQRRLRGRTNDPVMQGALLGALSARTH
ncbi:MAG: hypothetical protein QF903_08660 [Planctomycetota bacterium]|jgi:hypothetical protein|nr:hypothetical protein [Planctomycetota bacterium]MDP6989536.1 hypothetical protein [Planctomycetota bacterium]